MRSPSLQFPEAPIIRVVHITFGLDVGGQEKLLVELRGKQIGDDSSFGSSPWECRGVPGRRHRGRGLAGDRAWAPKRSAPDA